jgi:hypothetical protein
MLPDTHTRPAPTAMTQLFDFERDFVASLRCIPMAVRFKLDRCAIKLTLRQWSRFTLADRQRLLMAPCDAAPEVAVYRASLVGLVAARTGEDAKPLADLPQASLWEQSAVPALVADYAASLGLRAPTDRQWAALSKLQRFVLVKLTRDNHDNVNFAPALREFRLYTAAGDANRRVSTPVAQPGVDFGIDHQVHPVGRAAVLDAVRVRQT